MKNRKKSHSQAMEDRVYKVSLSRQENFTCIPLGNSAWQNYLVDIFAIDWVKIKIDALKQVHMKVALAFWNSFDSSNCNSFGPVSVDKEIVERTKKSYLKSKVVVT